MSKPALIWALICSLGLPLFLDRANAAGTVLLSETFVNLSNPWDSNLWNVDGDPTSDIDYPSSPAAHMVPDSLTATTGRLQLTDIFTNNERGYALYDIAQPTSGGLDIYFNASLVGDGTNTPADGLVFFLKDGSDTSTGATSLGLAGGALGYSAGQGMSYGTPVYFNGLSGGLLGIGFDAYGNYYQYPFVGLGCSANEDQSVIGVVDDPSDSAYQSKFRLVVRGSIGATRHDGYCRISTTADETLTITSQQRNVGVSLTQNTNANIFSETGTSVRIVIDPQDYSYGQNFGTGYIYIAPVGTTNWSGISVLTKFELPEKLHSIDTFKFGFVAGTGAKVVTTQVWSTRINSLRPIPRATWQTPPTFTGTVSENLNISIAPYLIGELNPTTFTIAAGGTGLPSGVSLTSDGRLTGATTSTGQFTFSVHAATAGGAALDPLSDQSFSLEISGCSNSLVTIAGGDKMICFSDTTTASSWTVPGGVTSIQYLIVGGGGGGGGDAAGGGAGGESLQDSLTVVPGQILTIQVGAGGEGGNANGSSGSASSISTVSLTFTANGGGGGHTCSYDPGVGYCTDGAGGIPGASGGAGGRGAYTTAGHLVATNGSDGTTRNLTGISLKYGAGGGGGDGGNCLGSRTGGLTGGGDGFKCAGLVAATNGLNILGAGGGGGGTTGGNGGSGSVYLRFTPPVQHAINYVAGPNGSISGGSSQLVYHGFSSQSVTAVAASGYRFTEWSDSSTSASRIDIATNAETFTAYFAIDPQSSSQSSSRGNSNLVPEIKWDLKNIVAGTDLSNINLGATSPIPGKFSYIAKPISGTNQVEITITFTPTDLSTYSVVSISKILNFVKKSEEPNPIPSHSLEQATVNSADSKTVKTSYKVADLQKLGTIYFPLDAHYLTESSKSALKKIALLAKSNKYSSLVIQGNTDIQRGVDNVWLSRVRAEAVTKKLAPQLSGVTLIREWYAGSRPAIIGFDQKAYAANRRVDIYAKVEKQNQTSPSDQSVFNGSREPLFIGQVTFNRNEYGLDGGDMKILKGVIADILKLRCKKVKIISALDGTRGLNNSWLAPARAQSVANYIKSYLPGLIFTIGPQEISAVRESKIYCY